ncbi:MAG: osmotically inducible protein OsmC [Azospirillum brasilense]|nr:MAG: osmotically inducible protein OsmC [Azospirillum brasilense]
MVAIATHYEGQLRCVATHGPSSVTLTTDAPKDNHGLGSSFSPTDLVATALATCILTTMGIVARRLEVNMDGAEADVTKEMTATPTRRVAALPVLVRMPAGVAEDHRAALEKAAHGCPVKESLHSSIAMPITFEWCE